MAKRRVSVHYILQKTYDVLPWDDEWEAAFSRPEQCGIWFVSGRPTNGKSSFCMKLTRKLASIGYKTAYFSYEEGTSLSFQNAMIRSRWADAGKNIVVEDQFVSFQDMEKWVKANKRVKVYIFDSIQRWDLKKSDLFKFRELFRNKLIVIISHVKDNGLPDGTVANELLRDASLKIWIEGFRAISRGRFFGSLGYYTIWEEKANEYWSDKIEQK